MDIFSQNIFLFRNTLRPFPFCVHRKRMNICMGKCLDEFGGYMCELYSVQIHCSSFCRKSQAACLTIHSTTDNVPDMYTIYDTPLFHSTGKDHPLLSYTNRAEEFIWPNYGQSSQCTIQLAQALITCQAQTLISPIKSLVLRTRLFPVCEGLCS